MLTQTCDSNKKKRQSHVTFEGFLFKNNPQKFAYIKLLPAKSYRSKL